jgi:RNA polymerase sigma-70 factor (ECF subfamily)
VPDYSAFTDQQLVACIGTGDEGAFDTLVRRYYSALLTYLTRAVRSQAIAEDLLQDLWLRVWQHHLDLPPDVNIRIYLYAAARNHVLDYHRGERRRAAAYERAQQEYQPTISEVSEWDTLSELEREEIAAAIRAATAALPERSREIWTLSRDHGLSYSEIAAVTGVSVNTVKTQVGRAMTALRAAIEPFLLLMVVVISW